MADIKQAAKWMQEGHSVRRHQWVKSSRYQLGIRGHLVWISGKNEVPYLLLPVEELLADDWEIAD